MGGALARRNQYLEAEPLLLAGHRGMEDREAAIPKEGRPRQVEAMNRRARLHEATGNQVEAGSWRARLAPERGKIDKHTAKN
jgi:hypothetical protein